jgi:hypothetical protein
MYFSFLFFLVRLFKNIIPRIVDMDRPNFTDLTNMESNDEDDITIISYRDTVM